MQSRRDLLRTTTGGAGVGLLAALAGCSDETSSDDGDANGTDGGDETANGTAAEDEPNGDESSESFDHTDWIYDPEGLGLDIVSMRVLDMQGFLSADGVPDSDETRENLESNYDEGLDADDVEYFLRVGSAEILTGSFNTDDIVDTMSLSPEDSYKGFDLYVHEDKTYLTIATDGEHLLRSERFGENSSREELEHLIDTVNGDANRLVDVNTNYQRVYMETDAGEMVYGEAVTDARAEERDDELHAAAEAATFDGNETMIERTELHANEESIDLEAIESAFEDLDNFELNDLEQDGRLLTLTYTGLTEHYV